MVGAATLLRCGVSLRGPLQMTLSSGIFWRQLAHESRCSENHNGFYVGWWPVKGSILALRRLKCLSVRPLALVGKTLVATNWIALKVRELVSRPKRVSQQGPRLCRRAFQWWASATYLAQIDQLHLAAVVIHTVVVVDDQHIPIGHSC